jgi:hypothetical protein
MDVFAGLLGTLAVLGMLFIMYGFPIATFVVSILVYRNTRRILNKLQADERHT